MAASSHRVYDFWTDDETKALLSIFGEEDIQKPIKRVQKKLEASNMESDSMEFPAEDQDIAVSTLEEPSNSQLGSDIPSPAGSSDRPSVRNKKSQLQIIMEHQSQLLTTMLEFENKQRERDEDELRRREERDRDAKVKSDEAERQHELMLVKLITDAQNKALASMMSLINNDQG
ncbi:Uncharacterised protein g6001 [Pycnogonum litorale]